MATNAEEFLLRLNSNIAPVAGKGEAALRSLDAQVRSAQRALAGLDTKAVAAASAAAAQEQKVAIAAAAVQKASAGYQGSIDVGRMRAAQAKLAAEQRALDAMNAKTAAAKTAADAERAQIAALQAARPALAAKASAMAAAAAAEKAQAAAAREATAAQKAASRDAATAQKDAKKVQSDAAKAAREASKVERDAAKAKKDVARDAAKAEANAAKEAAKAMKDAAKSAKELEAGASSAEVPMSGFASQIQSLVPLLDLGAASLIALGATALAVVLVAGALAAYGALVKFAFAAAGARREAVLLGGALEGVSRRPGAEFNAVVDQLARRVPLVKDKIQEIAKEMAILKLGGRDLQAGLTATAVVTSALGDAAGRGVRGIVEQSQAIKRFTLGARDMYGEYSSLAGTGLTRADLLGALSKQLGKSLPDVEKMLYRGQVKLKDGLRALEAAAQGRFGKTIAGQMLSFDNQVAKAKENFASFFNGVDLGPALEGLRSLLSVFDEGTVTGKTLKLVLTTGLQAISNALAIAGPIAKEFFLGMAIAALKTYIALKPIYNKVRDFFGFKQGDGLENALTAGKVALYAIGTAAGFVAVSLALAAVPFVVVGFVAYGLYKAATLVYAILSALWPVIATVGKVALIVLSPALALIALTIAGCVAGFMLLAAAVVTVGAFMFRLGAMVFGAFGKVASYLANLSFVQEALRIGGSIIDGLVGGIAAGAGALFDSVKSLGSNMLKKFKESIQSASPSKLFRVAGNTIPQGVALGVDDGASDVAGSIEGLGRTRPAGAAGGPPGAAIAIGTGGGRGDVSVTFNGPVSIGGAPADKEALADFLIGRITGSVYGSPAEAGA